MTNMTVDAGNAASVSHAQTTTQTTGNLGGDSVRQVDAGPERQAADKIEHQGRSFSDTMKSIGNVLKHVCTLGVILAVDKGIKAYDAYWAKQDAKVETAKTNATTALVQETTTGEISFQTLTSMKEAFTKSPTEPAKAIEKQLITVAHGESDFPQKTKDRFGDALSNGSFYDKAEAAIKAEEARIDTLNAGLAELGIEPMHSKAHCDDMRQMLAAMRPGIDASVARDAEVLKAGPHVYDGTASDEIKAQFLTFADSQFATENLLFAEKVAMYEAMWPDPKSPDYQQQVQDRRILFQQIMDSHSIHGQSRREAALEVNLGSHDFDDAKAKVDRTTGKLRDNAQLDGTEFARVAKELKYSITDTGVRFAQSPAAKEYIMTGHWPKSKET